MVICIICKKEFKNQDKFINFFNFEKENKKFFICKEDIKIILTKMKDLVLDPEPYKEHISWNKKEKALLKIAKRIYINCKNKHKKVDMKKIGDKIYDLMCEDCWDEFKKEELKYNNK